LSDFLTAEKLVNKQLQRVYNKLGASTRTAVAALAYDAIMLGAP
jgi:DNA-binding CsgD family transcriptional regulator